MLMCQGCTSVILTRVLKEYISHHSVLKTYSTEVRTSANISVKRDLTYWRGHSLVDKDSSRVNIIQSSETNMHICIKITTHLSCIHGEISRDILSITLPGVWGETRGEISNSYHAIMAFGIERLQEPLGIVRSWWKRELRGVFLVRRVTDRFASGSTWTFLWLWVIRI